MLLKCPNCGSKSSPSTGCSKCHGLGFYDPTIELRTKYWQEMGLVAATVAFFVAGAFFLVFGGSGDSVVIGMLLGAIGLGMLYLVFDAGTFPSNTRRLIRGLEQKYAELEPEKRKVILDDDAELITLDELLDEKHNSASQ